MPLHRQSVTLELRRYQLSVYPSEACRSNKDELGFVGSFGRFSAISAILGMVIPPLGGNFFGRHFFIVPSAPQVRPDTAIVSSIVIQSEVATVWFSILYLLYKMSIY